MKRFLLHTVKHKAALIDFAEKVAADEVIYIKNTGNPDGAVFYFAIAEREAFCETLLHLLCDIAEAENPIYKHSAKLRQMAHDLRKTPLFGSELRLLSEFVSTGKEIHLDGYVTFRMGEFKEKLDMMVYSLVKKLKFGNGD
jgi:hypothetical protein